MRALEANRYSASASSPLVAKRRTGALASARSTTRSSAGGVTRRSGHLGQSLVFGRDFGPTGTMRSDAPPCCPDNCGAMQRFALQGGSESHVVVVAAEPPRGEETAHGFDV